MTAETMTLDQEWIYTFGAGQRLRSTSSRGKIGQMGPAIYGNPGLPLGLPLHNRYVVIPAPSQIAARVLMMRIFGDVWSFEYSSREAAGVDEYGLVELDLTEVLAEMVDREMLQEESGDGVCDADAADES